jgi:hypothetical protein
MCEVCEQIKVNHLSTYVKVKRYDPTRTTALRLAFEKEMMRRFKKLEQEITYAIVSQDCFGLKTPTTFAAPPQKAFAFPRSADKVQAFMEWLQKQVDDNILTVRQMNQLGSAVDSAWTNLYIEDSYKRGVQRADYELKKAGFDGITKGYSIEAAMANPFHGDRLGLLYSRAFSDLKGITATMDSQISKILGQGIADGDGPALLARKILSTINGGGAELGIKDSLGRFIPAKTRAKMLARTEIIRAHHLASIQEYRNWGMEGVKVQAEWSTAGFNVCDECLKLAEGGDISKGVYSLNQIESMIPAHPNCRCMALPILEEEISKK